MSNGERGPEKEYPASVYVRMLSEQRDFIREVGNGNLSAGMRLIIDFARDNRPDLEAYKSRRRPPGRPPDD